MSSFDEWFKRATGNSPFTYQRRFAEAKEIAQLDDVPTRLGKTAMAVLGWLWRRKVRNRKRCSDGDRYGYLDYLSKQI